MLTINDFIKFRKVSLGTRHSSLIDCENNFYVFGWNKYGQLEADFNKSQMKLTIDELTIKLEEKTMLLNKAKHAIDTLTIDNNKMRLEKGLLHLYYSSSSISSTYSSTSISYNYNTYYN